MCNATVDALANVATRMTPLRDRSTIEILYKSSIPDKIANLCVFYDDKQILHFMANDDIFKDEAIDEYVHEQSL